MRKSLSSAVFLLAAISLCGFEVAPDGKWSEAGISAGWRIAAPGWSRYLNAKTCDFKVVAPSEGILSDNGKSIEFRSSWTKGEGDAILLKSSLSSADFPEIGHLDYELRVPFDKFRKLTVDGKVQNVPPELQKVDLGYFWEKNHEVVIETENGIFVLEGNFSLMIQDDRKWSNTLLLYIGRQKWKQTKALDIELKLKFQPGESKKIPLEKVVNMGFVDDKSEDGAGGWTDQGPNNDMRLLPPGKLSFAGVDFELIDPAKNNGKSCIVLSAAQKKFPANAAISVSGNQKLQNLYLLHASAWVPPAGTPIGTVEVTYEGGKTGSFPVISGVDGGNWWVNQSFRNAGVAWSAVNFESRIGLYASAFTLAGVPEKISFHPAGDAVWMICAASLSNRTAKFDTVERNMVIMLGEDWLPVKFSQNTEIGSPLDFSGSLDAPAGKYGRVVADKKGHFVFEKNPEKRIRFLGVNLCETANYFNREEAEEFTEQIARAGYNSVRFHHFENLLMDKTKSSPSAFDPKMLDSLQYLMACLKKRGIYYTLDLYASRKLSPDTSMDKAKLLFNVDSSAMENWKQFVKSLLTVKNPYTGLTLAEDPALYVVNLVNEDNISYQLPLNRDPGVTKAFLNRWKEYLALNKVNASPGEGGGMYQNFLNGLERNRIHGQTAFLRDEIGTGTLITDLNFISNYALSGVRSELQVVDLHTYWDHMRLMVPGKWGPPLLFSQCPRSSKMPRMFAAPCRIGCSDGPLF